MTIFKSDWTAYETGHPGAHNQIATRLNLTRWADDYASVQDAIDVGPGTVLFAAKTYTVPPLVLPRNPSTSNLSSVKLMFMPGARLKGDADSFAEGDALISWEASTARAYEQAICGVGGIATLELPNVAGVRAIHYAPTDKSDVTAQNAERLQIHVENLRFLGHNDYHQQFIYLEGAINRSVLRNLYGDPALGDATYETVLVTTDTDITGDLGNDWVGFNYTCLLEHLHSTILRGGRGAVFHGRLNASILRDCFCDGGTVASYKFVNSTQSTVQNLFTEGRGEQPAMFVFDGCEFMVADTLGIANPDEWNGSGFGHGLLLTGTSYSTFRNRRTSAQKLVYSAATDNTKMLIVIDEDSRHNTFTQFGVRVGQGGLADEIEDNGTGNDLSGLVEVS